MMWDLVERLWPILRSLTGEGNRASLGVIGETVPLTLHEVPSGTKVWSWTVPYEWNVREAYVQDMYSDWRVDWDDNHLHLLGYSEPINDQQIQLTKARDLFHTLPDQPDAIPYLTSYYKRRWGFCLTENHFQQMNPRSRFLVHIDTTLEPGSLTWAEAFYPGSNQDEILFSTYICHPNLANDNLSGMVVATRLAEYVDSLPNRRYSYRFVFAPETLGTLCFLRHHVNRNGRAPIAGYVLTTLGGPGEFHLKLSKRGSEQGYTLADKAAAHVLGWRRFSFTATGSDERQYCSPRVNWPVAVIGKPMFYTYPEYHTSLDNLDFMKEEYLEQSLDVYKRIVDTIEANRRYWAIDPGVPKLDERGLYPTLGGQKDQAKTVERVMEVYMFADGKHDLIDIADRLGEPVTETAVLASEMADKHVIEETT